MYWMDGNVQYVVPKSLINFRPDLLVLNTQQGLRECLVNITEDV